MNLQENNSWSVVRELLQISPSQELFEQLVCTISCLSLSEQYWVVDYAEEHMRIPWSILQFDESFRHDINAEGFLDK